VGDRHPRLVCNMSGAGSANYLQKYCTTPRPKAAQVTDNLDHRESRSQGPVTVNWTLISRRIEQWERPASQSANGTCASAVNKLGELDVSWHAFHIRKGMEPKGAQHDSDPVPGEGS